MKGAVDDTGYTFLVLLLPMFLPARCVLHLPDTLPPTAQSCTCDSMQCSSVSALSQWLLSGVSVAFLRTARHLLRLLAQGIGEVAYAPCLLLSVSLQGSCLGWGNLVHRGFDGLFHLPPNSYTANLVLKKHYLCKQMQTAALPHVIVTCNLLGSVVRASIA